MAEIRPGPLHGGRISALIGVSALLLVFISQTSGQSMSDGAAATTEVAVQSFLESHQFASVSRDQAGGIRRVYGRNLATGNSAVASAAALCRNAAPMLGVKIDDLAPTALPQRQANEIPVLYDPATGSYRFTALHFTQQRDGVDVYGSRLVVLVRNQPGFSVVLANAQLRNLHGYQIARADVESGITDLTHQSVLAHAGDISELQQGRAQIVEQRKVIFAGIGNDHRMPRLADSVVVQKGTEKWRIVADAETGVILDHKPLICRIDLITIANAFSTEGIGADICENESVAPLPFLAINANNTVYYTNKFGSVTVPGQAQQTITVSAGLVGRWFAVTNAAGPSSMAMQSIAPPGPAILTFNATNLSEHERAEVNAYIQANRIRDFVLKYNPIFPTLGGQGFPIVVNRDDLFCPGNAWYDIPTASLNFCEAGVGDTGQSFPNTAWSSIIYHEFGHHIVEVSGSGQGQYGEGFGDALSTVMLDSPLIGFGYFDNCTDSLRTADTGVSVPCSSSIHFCGQALSGCIWDTRNELINTDPQEYQDILANLLVNSVLLHIGSTIEQDLVIDFLTLDDDNANIFDGSPHFDAITTGFAAHGMIIPPLDPISIDFPQGLPSIIAPNGTSTIEVSIVPLSGMLEPGTVSATFLINGVPVVKQAQPTGRGNAFTISTPSATCGSRVQYWVTAQATDGTAIMSPFDAPANVHETVAAYDQTEIMREDFEQENGWTSLPLDATDGWWERGEPISDFLWTYGPPADSDGSGSCWLTGNHPGNSDVDDGSVRLVSPILNVSVDSGMLEYDYYLRLTNENGNDRIVVELTDGLSPWVEVARHDLDGGFAWHNARITPDDMATTGLTNTGTVQIRFTVSDLTPQSVVEAGIDNFRINELDCQPDIIPGDVNGDLSVDVFDLLDLLDAWGDCPQPCPPNCPADISPDCSVDVFDLLFLLNSWGSGPPPSP